MADKYVFADEAGNFDFSRKRGASRYFILTTVTMDECSIGDKLLSLRRELGWNGQHLDREFHAAEDPLQIRNAVFSFLSQEAFRIDATILDKPKAQSQVRPTDGRFYKIAWYLHFKYVAPCIISRADRLFVVASSLGTKKKRCSARSAIEDVVGQVTPCPSYRVAFWSTDSFPCLLVADYCSWAIQRKWEMGETQFYEQIRDKIFSEFDVWKHGNVNYY